MRGRRSYRDAAATGIPPRAGQFEAWEQARTLYLSPPSLEVAKKDIPAYSFGGYLEASLRGVPGASPADRHAVEKIVRTGRGEFKVQLTEEAAKFVLKAKTLRHESGTWTVAQMRDTAVPSLVVTGVPRDLSDDAVAEALIVGSKPLVPAAEAGALCQLRARRLFRGGGGGQPGSAGGPEGRSGSPSPPGEAPAPPPTVSSGGVPTASVRVFLSSSLLQFFCDRGSMQLRWSSVRCRPYLPRQFYCNICGGMGNHPT